MFSEAVLENISFLTLTLVFSVVLMTFITVILGTWIYICVISQWVAEMRTNIHNRTLCTWSFSIVMVVCGEDEDQASKWSSACLASERLVSGGDL